MAISLRVGVEVQDIDITEDVEEQARAAVVASIKVLDILNEGLQEVVADSILSINDGDATSVADTLAAHTKSLSQIRTALSQTVKKVGELVQATTPDDDKEEST